MLRGCLWLYVLLCHFTYFTLLRYTLQGGSSGAGSLGSAMERVAPMADYFLRAVAPRGADQASDGGAALADDVSAAQALAAPGGPHWVPRACFAKCPFTCQFDWLSDQLCQSLDRLSDHFAKH